MRQREAPLVVLTGAGGYLGKLVAQGLPRAGVRLAPLRYRSLLTGTETADEKSALREADVLCHLAGAHPHQVGPPSERAFWETNLEGTRRLLACVPAGCRIVFASSAMAAGVALDAGSGHGSLAYAGSKRAAERVISARADGGGTGLALRLHALAGAHRSPIAGLIGVALRAARDGTPLVINRQALPREYLHVADAAAAVVAACLTPLKGYAAVDIGTGRPFDVAAVVAEVERVTGKAIDCRRGPSRVEPAPRRSDTTVAAACLGWRPDRSDLRRIVSDQWQEMRRREPTAGGSESDSDRAAGR